MDIEDFLRDASERERGRELQTTIRSFIAKWGAKRRGYAIVRKIERDLERYGLTTQPFFTEGWIDTRIRVVRVSEGGAKSRTADSGSPASTVDTSDNEALDITLCFSSLESANAGVASVSSSDTLGKAQAIMLSSDYSQLAVMEGPRSLKGAVSWESIAQAKIRNPDAELSEAIVTADVVRSEDDLLSKIPRIIDASFVFVQGRDNKITGIVTTADLSEQFVNLAAPFFILAEIERRIRRIIDQKFTVSELQEVAGPSVNKRPVESADDLTFGAYCLLLEEHQRWIKLGWALDRKVFVGALHDVRNIRNDVMHFSPDPVDDEDVKKLKNFLKWLRRLDDG